MCDFKDLRRLRSIGPQPRAGSGLQDRPSSACPILVGWVPTATAAKCFRASYWNSSLKQALSVAERGCYKPSCARPHYQASARSPGAAVPQSGIPKALRRDPLDAAGVIILADQALGWIYPGGRGAHVRWVALRRIQG